MAWHTDAGTMDGRALAKFIRGDLLYKTNKIDKFLDSSNAEATVVAGPKGLGKTLLLRVLRHEIEGNSTFVLLPRRNQLDKLPQEVATLSVPTLTVLQNNLGPWKTYWTIAFIVPVLLDDYSKDKVSYERKAQRLKERLVCQELKSLIPSNWQDYDDYELTPSDILPTLLHLDTKERKKAEKDVALLVSDARHINRQYRLFLDNIDEYFIPYLNSTDVQNSAALWYNAQIGAIAAIHQLRTQNQHIRIYCSIRKEALDFGLKNNELGVQLRGGCITLSYTKNELKQIIIKNITQENKKRLFEKTNINDTIESRWVGLPNTKLTHVATGKEEHILDYILRHTHFRPREIMEIGKDISTLELVDRNERNIKRIVNEQAGMLTENYFTECQNHNVNIDQAVLMGVLKTNYLPSAECSAFCEEYNKLYNQKHSAPVSEGFVITDVLWKVGLMGRVVQDNLHNGDLTQEFNMVGSFTGPKEAVAPRAETYVFHPSLTELQMDDVEYRKNRNKINIIGHGQPWRIDVQNQYLVLGDMVGSSVAMNNNQTQTINAALSKIIAHLNTQWPNVSVENDNDSVRIVSPEPLSLLTAIVTFSDFFMKELNQQYRFGGHYAHLPKKDHYRNLGPEFRRAGRIMDKTSSSQLIVSLEFYNALSKTAINLSGWKTEMLDISKVNEAEEKKPIYCVKISSLSSSLGPS